MQDGKTSHIGLLSWRRGNVLGNLAGAVTDERTGEFKGRYDAVIGSVSEKSSLAEDRR